MFYERIRVARDLLTKVGPRYGVSPPTGAAFAWEAMAC